MSDAVAVSFRMKKEKLSGVSPAKFPLASKMKVIRLPSVICCRYSTKNSVSVASPSPAAPP